MTEVGHNINWHILDDEPLVGPSLQPTEMLVRPRPVAPPWAAWLFVGLLLAATAIVVRFAWLNPYLDGPGRADAVVPTTTTPQPTPQTIITIIYATTVVERIVLVTPEPAPVHPVRQAPPPPRPPQPAAWPAPVQPTAQPTAAPRVVVVASTETWLCADGYTYSPGAWDWLNGIYTEKQADGAVDVLESGRGVGGNPLRHRNCQIQQTQKAR